MSNEPEFIDMSDGTFLDMVDPNFLTPYHFDEKPATVIIRKVGKQKSYNKYKREEGYVNVLLLEDFEKGLIVNDTTMNMLLRRFKSTSNRDWIGKAIIVEHIRKRVAGDEHYLAQVSEKPAKQPAAPVKPAETGKIEELEHFGVQLYGEEWDTRRGKLANHFSNGRTNDPFKLSDAEADTVIEGLLVKINEKPVEFPAEETSEQAAMAIDMGS